ncbi:hypothetical protein G6F37_004403 [Rhizopus arrhizus]|nr:hypothetical protein G6F38_002188 [Rhizopus arrhizus]KAG1159977.1 hypothetical protein G6F37_004403 [Rhizopus arrhizus]
MSNPKLIGELAIVAYKARDLPNREIVGKQDPFVTFRLHDNIRKTKTDYRGGQHPIWDDQVNMPVPEKKKTMIVQIYDEDSKREDLISEGEVDLTKVLEEGEHDDWFPLQYKGRKAGEIYLEMTFYAAAPPPKRQPTRYGTRPHKPTGHAPPPVPSANASQYYPYPPSSQPANARPLPPAPAESQSTPVNYPGQYPSTHPSPYPTGYPPAPTPSISAGSQHHSGRPASYAGPQASVSHINRPTSPPVSTSNTNYHLAPNNGHVPLLSSPYNPPINANAHPNYGYPPSNQGGYPPYPNNANNNSNNNRNSYPPQTHSPYPAYPPSNNQFQGFPEPQQYPHSNSYTPHQGDPLGTPFAAHQGSFYPANQGGYPPRPYPSQQHQNMGYPPQNSNSGYPPY